MISASAVSVATSTAVSSGVAVNSLTGETTTTTSSATSTATASATATATAISDTFDDALNNAVAIASNNATKIASEKALSISNDIALKEALSHQRSISLKDVRSEQSPMSVNPFYPLTILEQQNISNYFLNNVLAGENIPDDVNIDLVSLIEPKKSDIIIFKNTGVLPVRRAEFCIYYIKSDIYNRYEVTLKNEEVLSISEAKTIVRGRPTWSYFENDKVVGLILADPACREKLRSKGLRDEDIDNNIYFDVSIDSRLDLINKKYGPNFSDFIYKTVPRPRVCFATPFWAGADEAFDATRAYIQPVNSIIFFVDTRNSKIMKIYDAEPETVLPIQKGNLNYERPFAPELKPLVTTMPQGPSFTINNNIVEWAGWEFTWSITPNNSVLLYDISFLDRTVWRENPNLEPVRRSMLYKANIGELLTCYGDDTIPGSIRNFFDIREFPARDFALEVIRGVDVPDYATMFDYNFTDVDGTMLNLPNRVAFYETDAGMLWRHGGDNADSTIFDGRVGRELVVSFVHVISNYDYIFNWIFSEDGQIEFKMIASGIVEADATDLAKVDGDADVHSKNGGDLKGGLILPYVYALNHSHIANIRLDFCVDGLLNKIEETEIEHLKASETNPYGNSFIEKSTLLTTEGNAIRDADFTKSRKWVIHNEFSKNYLGYERSIELSPYPTTFPFYKEQRPCQRAKYLLHDLHVTKYRENQLYSIGEFPIEKAEDTGLGAYIKNDESIVNEDIVVWYTFGFSHSPRIEDSPVMPREPVGFTLSTHNFFNENPGMYLAKQS